MKKYNIHKKSNPAYGSYKHLNDWLFFDNDLMTFEILSPTIDNIKLMTDYSCCFVVKGFKSIREFEYIDRLRFKFGFYAMMYLTRSVNDKFMLKALTSFINNEQPPTKNEVQDELKAFKLVETDRDEERIEERNKYEFLYNKYFIKTHRLVYVLIKRGRVKMLNC